MRKPCHILLVNVAAWVVTTDAPTKRHLVWSNTENKQRIRRKIIGKKNDFHLQKSRSEPVRSSSPVMSRRVSDQNIHPLVCQHANDRFGSLWDTGTWRDNWMIMHISQSCIHKVWVPRISALQIISAKYPRFNQRTLGARPQIGILVVKTETWIINKLVVKFIVENVQGMQ